MKNDLAGKTVVITGATSGIGLASAHQFVKSGAFVIGVGRSQTRIMNAEKRIKGDCPSGKIKFLNCDLSTQSAVRSLIDEVKSSLEEAGLSHLDVLINNAGVFLGNKQKTNDGIEMTFAVNHMAGFILAHGLMDLLSKAENGKVLSVTSYSHRTTPISISRIANPWFYISFIAYKQSKLCNVLFTYEFNRRFSEVTAFAVDPGLVNTSITSKGSRGISHLIWKRLRKKGTSPDEPVQTLLFLTCNQKPDTSKGFYYENCQPKSPSSKSTDERLAERLWEKSLQLMRN